MTPGYYKNKVTGSTCMFVGSAYTEGHGITIAGNENVIYQKVDETGMPSSCWFSCSGEKFLENWEYTGAEFLPVRWDQQQQLY